MKIIYLFIIGFTFTSCGTNNHKSYGAHTSFLGDSGVVTGKTALMSSSYADPGSSEDSGVSFSESDSEDSSEEFSESKNKQAIQSGSLTAGSFDDNNYIDVFRSFIDSIDEKLEASLFEWGERVLINLRNNQDEPIGNATIDIYNASSSKHVLKTTTASDGRAIFVVGWDSLEDEQILSGKNYSSQGEYDKFLLRVTTLNGIKHEELFSIATPNWNMIIPEESSLPQKLDLAFVIDATGSMDDEIRYIQVESANIARSVKKKFPNVDMRFSLIVYRDRGDEYIIRDIDFGDLEKFFHFLSQQTANGGGDFPEAMDIAISKASELNWRKGNVARLLFLIADAPPHDSEMKETIKNINILRKQGIKFFPIAASGIDEKAEYVMRIASFLSLGEYIFLTDDSGIGDPHAEPHIPFYHVQKLNVMIERMISSELTGKKLLPRKEQILRISGDPNFYKK